MRFVTFAILAILAMGCENRQTALARKKLEQQAVLQENVNNMVRDIEYIKDPRTGLCFAVHWHSLTIVPCEAIPTNMLTVAEVAK